MLLSPGKNGVTSLLKEVRVVKVVNQRFRKGVGGRGLATNSTQNTANILPQNCVILLIRGHRERGLETSE